MRPASGVLRLGWSFTTLSAAHREMHSRPQPQEQVTSQRGRGGRISPGPGTTLEGFRSSPFLSPASALQDFIFSCWRVSFLSSTAGLAEYTPTTRETVARATRNERIVAQAFPKSRRS